MTTAYDIYLAAFARVANLPGFKTVRKTPMFTVQPEELPRLSVYLLREQGAPDGDPNAGEPHFIHNMTLGFSGAIVGSDDEKALGALDLATAQILPTLFTDASFVKMIEGFLSFDRRLVFTRLGETPLSEVQIEMVLDIRSYWPPVVTDNLNLIHVETILPIGGDPTSIDQVIREYDFTQTARGNHANGIQHGPRVAGQRQGSQSHTPPNRRRVFFPSG